MDKPLPIVADLLELLFPAEWVRAALALALFSTLVVVGLFSYLNRYTGKSYFTFWIVAWMFYAVYLAAAIGLDESPEVPSLIMARRACIGISALFMFAGSYQLTRRALGQRELALGSVLITLWSYVAAYHVGQRLWITVPVFALLAAACWYTGYAHIGGQNRSRGGHILGMGFFAWGISLLVFPFLESNPIVMALYYFCTATLAGAIALAMTVQVLERVREQNEALLEEFRRGTAQRRLLEQEITRSEEKYRILFESASDAMLLVDLETLRIVEANQSALQLLGRTTEQLVNRQFGDICPQLRLNTNGLLATKKAVEALMEPGKEFLVVRADGARLSCEGSCNLVAYQKRPVLQVCMREVTERKRIERQMRQVEKLSALGRLIAGVAHELNNPLAVIMGYAQLLAQNQNNHGQHSAEAQKILVESERAAKIVRNLLSFARPRELQRKPTDVNRLVADLLDLHEHEFETAKIRVVRQLAADLPPTMLDAAQIEQVLSNLVANAVHAMARHNPPRVLTVSTEARGDVIRISVADTGPGIPPEIIERIFDPFFTTKSPGHGTGLGLSICHTIVEEHHGRIWAESNYGQGAVFHVELPLIACSLADDSSCTAMPELAAKRTDVGGRVLVVDDEPGILEVLRETLKAAGCEVDTANDGQEALRLIEQQPYDAILSDLCMPGMGGETLYSAVQALDPDLARRIIFITGDTVSTGTRAFLEATGNPWISKPFNLAEVQQKVAAVVAPSPTPVAA